MKRVNTIDELIQELQEAKEHFGGDFPVALADPDTGWYLPLYVSHKAEDDYGAMVTVTANYDDHSVEGHRSLTGAEINRRRKLNYSE